MFRLIDTAIAFCVVMLAASLFVSAAVQALQRLGRYRGRTLEHLLTSVLHGFRYYNNDPDVLEAEDPRTAPARRAELAQGIRRAELNFLADILSDPTLRGRKRGERPGIEVEDLVDASDAISRDALLEIVKNHAAWSEKPPAAAPEDDWPLPRAWVGERCPNATLGALRSYLEKWFPRLEAIAADGFKGRIRVLTFATASLFVVLANMDGLRLVQNLYEDSATRERAVRNVASLQSLAEAQHHAGRVDLGAGIATPTSAAVDLSASDAALAALRTIDQPGLGLGWQDSPIVKSFCAYRGTCVQTLPAIHVGALVNTTILWMLGLAFSAAMLSLGAPFWYRLLADFLDLRSRVQGLTKQSPTLKDAAAPANPVAPPSPPLP